MSFKMCVYDIKKIKFKIKNQINKTHIIDFWKKIKRLEYNIIQGLFFII